MDVIAKLDEHGKPAWITVMVLAFIIFWPIGLVILGYLIWSGRMGSSSRTSNGVGRWWFTDSHCSRGKRTRHQTKHGSGNSAFDEYREETLRRLEEEQDEFHSFLDRLRKAKDKAEFDQFMSDRRPGPEQPQQPEQAAG